MGHIFGAGSYGQHPKTFINILLGALCTGICLGNLWPEFAEYIWQIWLMVAAFLAMTLFLAMRCSKYIWLIMTLAIFLLGMGRYYMAAEIGPGDIGYLEGQNIRLEGTLVETPSISRDDKGKLHLKYVIGDCQVVNENGSRNYRGRLLAYANENSLDLSAMGLEGDATQEGWEEENKVALGRTEDKITLSGTIRQFHDYGNPGRMNTAMSNGAKGIQARFMADKGTIVVKPQELWSLERVAAQVRESYKNYMAQVMPGQDGAAIFAMLFGGYDGIKPELLEAFTITGIVHILSVSGSHITLMAGTAGILGKLLHLPDKATALLATGVIIFYGLLAGAIPPVIRSALMGILTLFALTLGRERDAQHVLGLTALGLLLYSPLWLYDISFQLSFGATAGLLYIAPAIRTGLRKRFPIFVADSLAVTIGAQLSVVPIIAWYFNVLSISSLLANLIVTPIVEWIIVAGLLAGLLASLIPFLGKLVFLAASLALGMVYQLSRWVAAMPGSQMYMPAFSKGGALVYYIILTSCIMPRERREACWQEICQSQAGIWAGKYLGQMVGQHIKLKAACLIASLFMLGGLWQRYGAVREMQVHFIDVGQGDAALIITPHGHAFMVDTGGVREGGYDIGKMVDVPYLLHYGVRQLDYIFLTHAHDDHAAGVKGILQKIPVGAIMIGHEGADDYLKTFGRGDAAKVEKLLAPLQENTIMELDGVNIEVLYSPEARQVLASNIQSTGNEFSNLLRVSYGRASFLFTGDLVAEQEAQVLASGTDVASTVLKVGHHGSRTSSSQAFLEAVNPKWAVISCGYANSFGHPHKEIVQRIQASTEAELLRTDCQGAVVFRTDGTKIKKEVFYK